MGADIPSRKRALAAAAPIAVLLLLPVFFPSPPFAPLNALTLDPVPGFRVEVPLIGRICEPLVGLPGYLASLHRPGAQAVSWLIWAAFIAAVGHVTSLGWRAPGRLMVRVALVWGGMALAALYIVFAPLPSVRLIPPDGDTVLLDVHSHTYYSHDGLASPAENISWHLAHNFTAWFVTDHWNTDGARATAAVAGITPPYPTVLGGEEASDDVGDYLLILGSSVSFTTMRWLPLKDLVTRAHGAGGSVISSLWWRTPTPLREIVAGGVDGLEIANGGHPSGPRGRTRELRRILSGASLTLWTASDWHGWGEYCWTWNALRLPGWRGLSPEDRGRAILSAIRGRTADVLPLLYGRRETQGTWRIVFSPIIGAYFYFSSLDLSGVLSWAVWTVLIALLVRSPRRRSYAGVAASIGGVFFLTRGAIYLFRIPRAASDLLLPVGAFLALVGLGLLLGGSRTLGRPSDRRRLPAR